MVWTGKWQPVVLVFPEGKFLDLFYFILFSQLFLNSIYLFHVYLCAMLGPVVVCWSFGWAFLIVVGEIQICFR